MTHANPYVAHAFRVVDALKLSDSAAIAFKEAICTRGKNAGYLLRTCPRSNTLAAAAWQGVIATANPYKLGICTLLFMSPEQKAVFEEIDAAIGALPREVQKHLFDRDRSNLETLNVW